MIILFLSLALTFISTPEKTRQTLSYLINVCWTIFFSLQWRQMSHSNTVDNLDSHSAPSLRLNLHSDASGSKDKVHDEPVFPGDTMTGLPSTLISAASQESVIICTLSLLLAASLWRLSLVAEGERGVIQT